MVHEGPNRRTQEITLRLFHAGMREIPLSQNAHTFFSDITGRYSWREAMISWSGRRSFDGIGRKLELLGLNFSYEPIASKVKEWLEGLIK